jgi:dihydroxyacetone kinase-like predicted kinase
MKYLFILLFGVVSCSPQFHINKAKKHTEKAISKGAVITSNESTVINDTIVLTEIVERGDTIFKTVTKTVEKVIYKDSEIRYITKKDKRKEVKAVKRKDKLNFKKDKLNIKLERVRTRRKKRSLWYVWLLIGSVAGYILNKKFG